MLRSQPGIYSIKVALLAERGVIEYDPSVWTPEKIINVSQLCLIRHVLTHLRRRSLTWASMRRSL